MCTRLSAFRVLCVVSFIAFFSSSSCFSKVETFSLRQGFPFFISIISQRFPPEKNSPRILFFKQILYPALFIDAREYCARVRGLTRTPYRTPAYQQPRDICRQLSNRPRSINVRIIGAI
jgi:hypothetical protein